MPDLGDIVDGKYRLERKLGEGGMGAIFQAVHQEIGKKVAIKFLHAKLTTDSEQVERFKREARAAAAAGHHGIIDIHDIGVAEEGANFLVMEFLRGQSMAELLVKDGPQPTDRACFVIAEVLSALCAAHAASVVHRDLKPDNIFLVDTGAPLPGVKLLDFGISRFVGPSPNDESGNPRLTQTGMLMGTPYYMSPEQAKGVKDLDHRTDIYSAGAVLYECLTGQPPFAADNYNALIAEILTEELTEPSEHLPDIDEGLEHVILKALTKNRGLRYQTAKEMLEALLPFVDEGAAARIAMPAVDSGGAEPIDASLSDTAPQPRSDSVWATPTVVAQSPQRKWVPWILGAALLVAVGVGAAYATGLVGGGEVGAVADDGTETGALVVSDAEATEANTDAGAVASSPSDAGGSSAVAAGDGGSASDGGEADTNLAESPARPVQAAPRVRVRPVQPRVAAPPAAESPPAPAKTVRGRLGTEIDVEYD